MEVIMDIKSQRIESKAGRKPNRIRCLENGREWDSIRDLCKEFNLNLNSVNYALYTRKKYGGYNFEFIK